MKTPTMAVQADNARWFAVRYLPTGARYGRTGAYTIDKDTVEFWDLADADDSAPGEQFGPLGQFVSRYYVAPLLDEQSRDLRVIGLCLDGGNAADWSVDGPTMRASGALVGAADAGRGDGCQRGKGLSV